MKKEKKQIERVITARITFIEDVDDPCFTDLDKDRVAGLLKGQLDADHVEVNRIQDFVH